MRVAVIGASGQLGSDLTKAISDVIPLTHADIEITDADHVSKVLGGITPHIVINTAAYNLVDQAEDDSASAFAVNSTGPQRLAEWCQKHQATLVHISTDYVFGQDEKRSIPYTESDAPGPLGAYGASKLDGEKQVSSLCDRHFIIRTCGLYGHAATRVKGNFVTTMLRLGKERQELNVVSDQLCTPTSTGHLAKWISSLIRTDAYGLYHATNSSHTSWYEFAKEIFRIQNIPVKLNPIPSSGYPTKAKRPAYSVLDVSKLERVLGTPIAPWQQALQEYFDTQK